MKKILNTKSCFERKSVLSYMLARKITRGMQSKPPAAELDGKDKHVCHLRLMELCYTMSLRKKDKSSFERININYI